MKRQQPEFRLHCLVADYLRVQYPELLWTHVPNGEKRSPSTGARLKRMGVRPGWADIQFHWLDSDYCLNAGAIELKAGKGKLQDSQEVFRNAWVNIGGHYAICRSLDDVIAHMESWGVPKGHHCPTRYAEGYIPQKNVREKRPKIEVSPA